MVESGLDLMRVSPSDLLARLCGIIHAGDLNPAGHAALATALDAVTAEEPDEAPADPAGAYETCEQALQLLGGTIPRRLPSTGEQIRRLLRATQMLDRWHEPALPRYTPHISDAHRTAQDRLAAKQPRFNVAALYGSIIPGEAAALPFQASGAEALADLGRPGGLMRQLLFVTAYLPPTLVAADPDEEDPAKGTVRTVRVRYRIAPASAPGLVDRAPIRVGIAPMAEQDGDLRLSVVADRYSVTPAYPAGRLRAVLDRAIDEGVHILCMPEMSVAEANLAALRDAIPAAREDHMTRSGTPPALRYVMAGVAAPPESGTMQHRNYLIVLDREGEEVGRQHKLRHWNLNGGCQTRFAIAKLAGATTLPPMLFEDTDPGREVTIIDLPGLGRTFALICADMNQDAPGHWLLENVRVNWLFAPIMDGSTCWSQGKEPWIIRKAERAATLSGGRVVVTNSMIMTQWNNTTTRQAIAADPACPFRLIDRCGIGLLLDATQAEVRQQHVTVDIAPLHSPVVEVRSWDGGWSAFYRLP